MASIILRSRISSIITRNKISNRRFYSVDNASIPNKESIISSQSVTPPAAAAASASTPEPPPESAKLSGSKNKALKFFKYGLITSVTGATAAAGYATYAYTVDELDAKVKALRESASKSDGFSSAVKEVSAKIVDRYLDLRRYIEEEVRGFTEPTSEKLLPDLHPAEQHVFTLVLDLNDTIIYSDWRRERGWRTFKRPGVDDFLKHLGRFYEIVIYSDQLNMYVDPIVERLDTEHYIRHRLSRSATKYQDGKHYRDLSKLNRDPRKILYVSAHAFENTLQPENCIPIKPFKVDEMDQAPVDTALLDLIPFLEYVARASPADIRTVLGSYNREDIAKEFIERSKDHQKRIQEQRQQGGFFRRR